MQCKTCGHTFDGKALFCPNCGNKLSIASQERSTRREPFDVEAVSERKGCGLSIAVLLIGVIVTMAILGLAAGAYFAGLQDRERAQQAAAQGHLTRGKEHAAQGHYELAIAEYEQAAQLDPDNERAIEELRAAQQHLQASPTDTPILQVETKAAYLDELRAAYAASDWDRVFDSADRLLALDPEFERGEVNAILFEAFYRTGLQLVDADKMKEAVRLFDRALALQPDNVQVSRAKQLASLYVAALDYWGADWDQAASSLQQVYAQDPEYKDARDRLLTALTESGGVHVGSGNYCLAAEQYAQAIQLGADEAVQQRYREAQANCDGQVPTRAPQPTVDGATPVAPQPPAPSGAYVGRVVEQTGIADTKMFIRGKVIDANGRGVAGVQVKIQAWDWSALAITDGNGQYAFDGLSNEVTYTLSLVGLQGDPVEAPGEFGRITWVDFRQAP